jgi:hypothetical protein
MREDEDLKHIALPACHFDVPESSEILVRGGTVTPVQLLRDQRFGLVVARAPGEVEKSRFSDLKNTRLLSCAIHISILKIGFKEDRDVECVLSLLFESKILLSWFRCDGCTEKFYLSDIFLGDTF